MKMGATARRRGSSGGAVRIIPKLARWAGVGVFVLAAAGLVSCDEEERQPYGGPWRIVKTPPEAEGTVKDIFFLDANTGWASTYGILLKWNGKEWFIQKKFVHPIPDADYCINPIWAFAEDDVWLAGGEKLPNKDFHSKIWHFNGEYWEDVEHPDVGGLGHLWFNSPTDGWAMGGYYMLRWDGKEWELTEWQSSATTGVWFNAPDDGWRTTPSRIYHWDGVTWTKEADSGAFEAFYAIAFNGPDSGWAGLGEGFEGYPHMYNYDGQKWVKYDGFPQDLCAIDFSDRDNGCAAGVDAWIYKNGKWFQTNKPGAWFWCVECVGPDDVWAGTDTGDIYHFTGFN